MYEIIDVVRKQTVPMEVSDPKEATELAARWKRICNRPFRIKKMVTPEWMEREAARMADGTYTPLPTWITSAHWWQNSIPARRHFAHYSDNKQGIAFTEDDAKGSSDIQTVMKPARYLRRFFSNILSQSECRTLGSRFLAGALEIKFGDKPEDFERVYERQSVCSESSSHMSCMHYSRDHFGAEHHPAYVYGAGDLAIAYFEDPENDMETGVLYPARAVVWPEKKTFVRVYGATEHLRVGLQTRLEELGYRRADNFEGAHLLAVNQRRGTSHYLLMPYMDGNVSAMRMKDGKLQLDRNGDFGGCTTDGWIRNPNVECDHCKGIFYDSSMRRVSPSNWDGTSEQHANSELVCRGCASTLRLQRCTHSDDWFRPEDMVNVYPTRDAYERNRPSLMGRYWARRHSNYFYCDRTNAYYYRQAFSAILVKVLNDDGTITTTAQRWCRQATEGQYFVCQECGDKYANECRSVAGSDVCMGCQPQKQEREEYAHEQVAA